MNTMQKLPIRQTQDTQTPMTKLMQTLKNNPQVRKTIHNKRWHDPLSKKDAEEILAGLSSQNKS
jgi:hypothetical protein